MCNSVKTFVESESKLNSDVFRSNGAAAIIIKINESERKRERETIEDFVAQSPNWSTIKLNCVQVTKISGVSDRKYRTTQIDWTFSWENPYLCLFKLNISYIWCTTESLIFDLNNAETFSHVFFKMKSSPSHRCENVRLLVTCEKYFTSLKVKATKNVTLIISN